MGEFNSPSMLQLLAIIDFLQEKLIACTSALKMSQTNLLVISKD